MMEHAANAISEAQGDKNLSLEQKEKKRAEKARLAQAVSAYWEPVKESYQQARGALQSPDPQEFHDDAMDDDAGGTAREKAAESSSKKKRRFTSDYFAEKSGLRFGGTSENEGGTFASDLYNEKDRAMIDSLKSLSETSRKAQTEQLSEAIAASISLPMQSLQQQLSETKASNEAIVAALAGIATALGSLSATAGGNNSTAQPPAKTDLAERLESLEKVRHLLSPEEYDMKRKEILSAM